MTLRKATNKVRERAQKRSKGLKRFEIWVPDGSQEKVKEYVKKLIKEG